MADFEGAKKHILRHLEENLPEHLSYHSVDHTLDVYAVAMDLSEHYGLDPADRQILATAALLHDVGFVGNEQDWNKLQQRFLESHDYHTDYSKERREPVKQMHLEQVREIVAAYDD